MLNILDECGSKYPAIAQLQRKVLQQSHTVKQFLVENEL